MKTAVKPPTQIRERNSRQGPQSVRLSPELLQWVSKAAYRAGMTISAFMRVAARNEADRVMGYDRDHQRSRYRHPRPVMNDQFEPTADDQD